LNIADTNQSTEELRTAVNDKLNIISNSLASLDSSVASYELRVARLESQLASAETRLLEAENNLATFEAATNDTLSAMLETESMLTSRVLNHEERIKALEDKIATLSVEGGGTLPANVVTQDSAGNVTLAGIFKAEKVEAKGVVAGSYSVKNDSSAPTTGDGEVIAVKTDADHDGWDDVTKVDGKSARVKTEAMSVTAKIFVTFEGDPGSRWWVEKVKDPDTGKLVAFSVNVAEAVKQDVKFSWFIVESH